MHIAISDLTVPSPFRHRSTSQLSNPYPWIDCFPGFYSSPSMRLASRSLHSAGGLRLNVYAVDSCQPAGKVHLVPVVPQHALEDVGPLPSREFHCQNSISHLINQLSAVLDCSRSYRRFCESQGCGEILNQFPPCSRLVSCLCRPRQRWPAGGLIYAHNVTC